MIRRVTITGADDSIPPEELLTLQKTFPFAEWGILVSRKRFGVNRFPSREWLNKLVKLKKDNPKLSLACHLCGNYVVEFYNGESDFISSELSDIWEIFDRVQLNTHGELHAWHSSALDVIREDSNKEFIFQCDGINTGLFDAAVKEGLGNISGLFDLSHGAGVLPNHWPLPFSKIHCGYAGGLSPDNLAAQIQKIEEMVSSINIWIDMETHVRSGMDQVFDLKKVTRCLEISAPHIDRLNFKRY